MQKGPNKQKRKKLTPAQLKEEAERRRQTILASFQTSVQKTEDNSIKEPEKVIEPIPEFSAILEKFKSRGTREETKEEEKNTDGYMNEDKDKNTKEEERDLNNDETKPVVEETAKQSHLGQMISKKQQKRNKLKQISRLKLMVERPDLVEVWDLTSPDPALLIQLKAAPNTVEVPRHWTQKKKFLQGKKGFFRRVFKLPEAIERTGIAKLRDPMAERDSLRMVKQKIRERMAPRLGKIDIDYQVLHDAFFKHSVKPKLTAFGDIYFEGKEEAMKMRGFRPGVISASLREALGISEGAPPPWLPAMQKFGPPPAYPNVYRHLIKETTLLKEDLEYDPTELWGIIPE